jgi:uncharacterized DUF497 family protein
MDETFELCGQMFEWNQRKAFLNELEHGICFPIAASAFMDPASMVFPDDEHSEEEVRDCLLGTAARGQLLRVSFTERPPNLRIISARAADSFDEKRYATGY